jgi:hypothetical protein
MIGDNDTIILRFKSLGIVPKLPLSTEERELALSLLRRLEFWLTH